MSLYKREYQFGNYLIRLMERSRKEGSSCFRVEEKNEKNVRLVGEYEDFSAAADAVESVAREHGDTLFERPVLEQPHQNDFRCRHGRREGSLMLCELPAGEIGALPVWTNKEDGRVIVTPFWCLHRCTRRGGAGHI